MDVAVDQLDIACLLIAFGRPMGRCYLLHSCTSSARPTRVELGPLERPGGTGQAAYSRPRTRRAAVNVALAGEELPLPANTGGLFDAISGRLR
jgi:hypothetical protein